MNLDEDTIVEREAGQLSTDMGNEVIILELSSKKYISLDDVGAFVWEELKVPNKIGKLIEMSVSHFEVDRDTCKRDLLAFLSQLIDLNLIKQS